MWAEGLSILLRVLAPIAPHLAHAAWAGCSFGGDLLDSPWPEPAEDALQQDEIELMMQVNGKLRGSIKVPADATREAIEALALASDAARRHLEGKTPKKLVVVPGRLVNIVI